MPKREKIEIELKFIVPHFQAKDTIETEILTFTFRQKSTQY